MNYKQIQLKPFQDRFVFSEKRYPCLIAGIGTGKSLCLLAKATNHCEAYPNALALVVRKNYTDLRDSTIKDFERYFGKTVDSNKEYRFPNGSVIMFRHGDEMDTLRNLNLSLFAIEQAEEFETDETFLMLRDRLRRDNVPLRQGIVIGNARGKNWIWQKWVYQPSEEYDLVTATTFDNADNLPKDFIDDLKRMETEAPNHYKQYVLNDFSEVDADDLLLKGDLVYNSPKIEVTPAGSRGRTLGCDVARFGEDETVFAIVENKNIVKWELIHMETGKNKSLMESVGKVIDMAKEFRVDQVVVDDIGMGGGVTDRLNEMKINVMPFNSSAKAMNEDKYFNRRSEGYFRMQELFIKGYIKILEDPRLMEQLLAIRFKYHSSGTKAIVSKDEMRKAGLHSPDRADALMMALYFKDSIGRSIENSGYVKRQIQESERLYEAWNPFER